MRPMSIVLRMFCTGTSLFINLIKILRPFRNQQVVGSIPTAGSTKLDDLRPHAIRPACRMMLRIMSGKMMAWNGSMEYQ